jgi:hypothetical protein
MTTKVATNPAQTRGASLKDRFCVASKLIPALETLPAAPERRIVGLREPASGESRLTWITMTNSLIALVTGANKGLGKEVARQW